jgi:hypothetical protein
MENQNQEENLIKKVPVADALVSLRPGAHFICRNDEFDWLDENEEYPPTSIEIEAERVRLYEEYLKNQYQRDRMIAYPSIQDQLDILYHQGYDGWKASIDEVKSKYPKPGET